MHSKTVNPARSWSPAEMPRLDGKTIVITGGNSGIGYESARMFAQAGAAVVLACRSAERAKSAVEHIRAETPTAAVEFMELDLANLASVRTFAAEVSHRFERIDVLCNNAGVMTVPYKKYSRTVDGFEMHFGINHLGHFALTGLLFNRMADGARIVTVSSSAHKIGQIDFDFDDLQMTRDYRNAYGVSKLANLLFTYELDRRLRAKGLNIKSVACHPGVAQSSLIHTGPAMTDSKPAWWLRLAYLPAQSAANGALPEVYAAVGTDIESGDYIGPSGHMESRGLPRKVDSSPRSHDVELAKRLWLASEELTGVRFPLA